jgi:hypothetical protein
VPRGIAQCLDGGDVDEALAREERHLPARDGRGENALSPRGHGPDLVRERVDGCVWVARAWVEDVLDAEEVVCALERRVGDVLFRLAEGCDEVRLP